MSGYDESSGPTVEVEDYQAVRLQRAQAFFAETLADYDEERLATHGVYAEIHGYDPQDAVLALMPDLPLSVKFTEYGHSVFDNMLGVQIFQGGPPIGTPDQIRKVEELGFHQSSVLSRGMLRERDGKRILSLFDESGDLPGKRIVQRIQEHFGVDVIAFEGEVHHTEGVPPSINFDMHPLIMSDVHFTEIEGGNSVDVEVGVSSYINTRTDELSTFFARHREFGATVGVDLGFVHARVPTHGVLAGLAMDYYEALNDHRADNIEHGSRVFHGTGRDFFVSQTSVRYMIDAQAKLLKLEVLVEPEMTKKEVARDVEALGEYCGILLVATLEGFKAQRPSVLEGEVSASYIITTEKSEDESESVLTFAKTFPVVLGNGFPNLEMVMPQSATKDWWKY